MSAGGKLDRVLARAVAAHQAGQFGAAEADYDKNLRKQPRHAQALHLKGVALLQQGAMAEAVPLLRRAIDAKPDYPEALVNLGRALGGLGELDAAVTLFQRAVAQRPDFSEASRLLGEALSARGEHAEAVPALIDAIRRTPRFESAQRALLISLLALGRTGDAIDAGQAARRHCPHSQPLTSLLAGAFGRAGRYGDAATLFEALAKAAPNEPSAAINFGAALVGAGRLDEGIAVLRDVLERAPDSVEAANNLATALLRSSAAEKAVTVLEEAIMQGPPDAKLLTALGNALKQAGRLDAARTRYLQAAETAPEAADPHNNLGVLDKMAGRITDAIGRFEAALDRNPGLADARCNLATALQILGAHDAATAAFEQAAETAPDHPGILSNLLMGLVYQETIPPGAVFRRHRGWQARFAGGPARADHANPRDPARRLTVGYVSADLRDHAVARFLAPLLDRHDRAAVRVACYANDPRADAVTERLRAASDLWRPIHGLTDGQAAEAICSDGCDILVDLSGHTKGGRLGLFALKPAPLQATWLGYPNTTGLDAIDLRLTDAIADPDPEADPFASERLVRLPHGFLCYRPPEPAPGLARAKGPLTFGSFNNLAKLTDRSVALFAAVLEAVPGSRLLLKSPAVDDPEVARHTVGRFAAHSVGDRVRMLGHALCRDAHLAAYGRIDIALDTAPYCGTTTTCEALWMGVPVLTVRGARHAGRVGASLLTRIGAVDWIAESDADLPALAARLADAGPRDGRARRSVRDRLHASPLMDEPGFARSVEQAYRDAWAAWCAS